jgi:hypothetical protein
MIFASKFRPAFLLTLLIAFWTATSVPAAPRVTSPKQQFGFDIGDDYCLANYQQLVAYWTRLGRESNRIRLVSIGATEEGRPQWMAIVSEPANLRRLEQYRDISRRLALAEGLTDPQASALATRGRAIVWIDGGLHATETLGAQQLLETVHCLLSRDDAEVRRILDDVIILVVPANPDGMDLVSDWYMREPDPKKRTYSNLPRLYQKYIGHDNNRDFYALTQAETRNMSRVMFREWFPQIIYNHHQSGPPGTVMFAPPFRDPFNYHYDPRVINGLDVVGAAMMARFLAEGKPGVTVRSGARYSTWYNGGLRTACYFHNAIGLLTETIGNPTPFDTPFNPQLQLPRGDLLAPLQPQRWHFRQSIEYSVTANLAVLDYASRHRTELLWNRYAMGRDAIAAGSRDSWTPTPTRVAQAQEALKKAATNSVSSARSGAKSRASAKSRSKKKRTSTSTAAGTNVFSKFFRNPADRDPRGYVLPASQPDFATATRFINTLIENGVRVCRATNDFAIAGRTYPVGSFVVACNQAFRAQVLDSFEPQDHPNDLQYPGGPPIPPYDITGWTPALQMAVQFDRVFESVKGPFKECRDVQTPLPGQVVSAQGADGLLLRPDANNAFRAVNRLLATGKPVQRLVSPLTTAAGEFAPGTFYLPHIQNSEQPFVQTIAAELGVSFVGTPQPPAGAAKQLRPVRIGLWDRYGGSISSGWARWLLEKFEFPFEVVFPPRLDQGNLRGQFDVLIFVNGAIPSRSSGSTNSPSRAAAGSDTDTDTDKSSDASAPRDSASSSEESLPLQYRGRRGSVTATNTIPKLREFVEAGGTVITIGSSTALAEQLGLPLASHLVEDPRKEGEKPRALPREKFYIPGSLVRARVDNTQPLAWGLGQQVDFMFQNNPVLRLKNGENQPGDGDSAPLHKIAWFDEKQPLRSGWALGQGYLQNGLAVVEAQVGRGRLVLCGPEIIFRAQPYGTFKFLFNGIVNAGLLE